MDDSKPRLLHLAAAAEHCGYADSDHRFRAFKTFAKEMNFKVKKFRGKVIFDRIDMDDRISRSFTRPR